MFNYLTNLTVCLTNLNFIFNVLKININVIRNFVLRAIFNGNISINKCYKDYKQN